MTPPNSPSDPFGALMRAAHEGDSAAYGALLRAITPLVRRIVRRQRGFAGTADTEDLVQDVLLSVHAARATYDPSRPFMAWLVAIVRHRLADGARRYAKTSGREVPLDDVTFAEPEANVDFDAAVEAEALRDAVRALPAGQRRAIELLKLEELSLKEAAVASGTSAGALKVAAHRAVATLRRTLGTKRR